MADQNELLTGSIDDYLLGLADGIQKAQRQLSQMALVVQPNEAPVTYQIPRVDFELKLAFEMTNVPGEDGLALRFRPAGTQRRGGATGSTEASSIIKGAFIAVPVHGGKPTPVIRTTLRRISGRRLEISVFAASAAGEKLSGVDVQFNVDRDYSKTLAPMANVGSSGSTPDLLPGTRFWDGLVTTDASGIAVGVLNVDPAEPTGTRVAAVVDVLGRTETIVFQAD